MSRDPEGSEAKASQATQAPLAVLGAGSWGTALAVHGERVGLPVRLFARDTVAAEGIDLARENRRYLPGVRLGPGITVETDLARTTAGAHLMIVAVPSQTVREFLGGLMLVLRAQPEPEIGARVLLLAAKGIEVGSLALMHDVAREVFGTGPRPRLAVLGGPSFAAEVAAGSPTAVVVASEDPAVAAEVQRGLSSPSLRVYVSDDVRGVEIGGALKNVIAVAAGICDGAGLGHNARAALITRGLAEMRRLATAMGAHPETMFGLAGVGDLVLTCTGALSRNRKVGLALGRGEGLEAVLCDLGMVAEGISTTLSAFALAQRMGVEMPILETMHGMLYGNLAIDRAVAALMGRSLKAERA